MKMNTKTTTKETAPQRGSSRQLSRDLRDSIMVVSVIINAYVFIAWLVLQVTTRFDAALINYLQNR